VKPNHSDANALYKNIPTEDDQILLFTEHNLDTKEDEKHDKTTRRYQNKGSDDEYEHLFDKKQENFQKLEGFVGKKRGLDGQEVEKHIEKNNSEKSIIFAPFNSSFSQYDENDPEAFDWPSEVKELLEPKNSKILRFNKKCRDLNREYEGNNNADLDNGVYNAFVNEQEKEAEE
jgi:hypothetical protein